MERIMLKKMITQVNKEGDKIIDMNIMNLKYNFILFQVCL